MNSNIKYIVASALVMVFILLVGAGVSYAFFELEDNNIYYESSGETTTFDIESNLSEKDGIKVDNIPLIDESEINEKAITIDFNIKSIAKTKSPGKFNIYMKDVAISKGLKDSSFKWQIEMDGNIIETGDFSNIDLKGTLDTTKLEDDKNYYRTYYLANNINLNGYQRSNIKVRIYLLNDSEKEQNNLLDGSFEGKLAIEAFNTSYLCYKAENLHSNNSITYGNIANGENLVSGDAFDCDVNGDGKYDKEKERFYYLTDASDEKYAVLIYSNNVYNGEINNTQPLSYSSEENGNLIGPNVAYASLPLTDRWISKIKTGTNEIKDENGNVLKADFSVANLASRMVRIDEILKACPNARNSINNCQYLFENTSLYDDNNTKGYWIENLNASDYNSALAVNGANRTIEYENILNSTNYGVRPVIEVLKNDISF